jgi:hypothetical protein
MWVVNNTGLAAGALLQSTVTTSYYPSEIGFVAFPQTNFSARTDSPPHLGAHAVHVRPSYLCMYWADLSLLAADALPTKSLPHKIMGTATDEW